MKLLMSREFLLAYIIGLCVALPGEATIFKREAGNPTCHTQGCNDAAQLISENIDTTVNPCDNFYRFACGRYIKDSEIQEGIPAAAVMGSGDERLTTKLTESIEGHIGENEPRAFRILKSHYQTCIDVEKIERNSERLLREILRELGGWPVLQGRYWNGSTFDWKRLSYLFRRLGFRTAMLAFVKFALEIDEKSNTQFVITLDQADFGITQEYLAQGMENDLVQAYYDYMVNVTTALGSDERTARRELADSLKFEIELAKISLSALERSNQSKLYNPMTLNELEYKYRSIPWMAYINALLNPYNRVTGSQRIIVRNPNYLKSLSELIDKTSKRALANYGIWRAVKEAIPYLSQRFLDIEAKFNAHTSGTEDQRPRQEKCISYVQENLSLSAGALFIRKAFNKNFKKDGEELVENLRRSFRNSIEKVEWMDQKTKRAALDKLQSMQAHIAYPYELLDDKELDKHFEHMKLVPDSFLDSYLSVSLFEIRDTYEQLGNRYNKTEWTSHGDTAVNNAFYALTENSLQVPAGFFQDELFTPDRPKYLNYGGIGYFMGHELTHGFDNQGSQFDKDGNLVNWWEPRTEDEYQRRARCMINQYSNYNVKQIGQNVNGEKTLGENIADNGAIKQAYHAWEEYVRRNGPEPGLPGLRYTPEQLFWLGHANIYCEKVRNEALSDLVANDEHCTNEFRVVGTLSNMPEFARAFQCPPGSPMNPVNKCSIW